MRKGFTSIELLVATAVLMSVTGFGVSNYLNFDARQKLDQAGKNLKNNLRLAQNSALSGEKEAATCQPNHYLTGWCFSPNASPNNNTYSVYGGCSADLIPLVNVATFKQKRIIMDGLTITAWDEFGNELDNQYMRILFKPTGDERVEMYNGVGKLNLLTYCLSVKDISSVLGAALGDLKYKIQVTSGGDIKDYGIVTPCP